MFFYFVQKSGLERLAKQGIVEMLNDTPKPIVRETTFRNKAMNVGIPFKRTALNKQSKRERSSRKKWRSSSSMVKTQWRWVHWISLKAMELDLSWQYLTPQVGQNLLVHRKDTNLRFPHLEQAYIAPPNEGSPQLIILSTLSITAWRGCKIYNISS